MIVKKVMVNKYILALALFYSHVCHGQKLFDYYFPKYRVHVSLPENWNVDTNVHFEIYVKHKILEDDLVVSFYYLSPTTLSNGKDSFFKSFTIYRDSLKSDKKRYMSENFTEMKFQHLTAFASKYNDITDKLGYDVICEFLFYCNDKTFALQTVCPGDKIDKYEELFLRIANSVYFD